MNIIFQTAKNNEITCSLDDKFLHSAYNPSREAETFVQSINPKNNPACIFIIEPCLGYCATFLKEKFPKSKIAAIRFFNDFHKNDELFDYVFYFTEDQKLADQLYNILGEEELCASVFYEWNASCRLFGDITQKIWLEIKQTVNKAKNVLVTRSFFSKRWLKNTVNFFLNAKSQYFLKKTDKPFLIACSGPSLKTSIPFIKEHRKRLILLSVSSSLAPLLKNKIIPDFVISTDGGYWAKKHLEFDKSILKKLYFALTPESSCSKNILSNAKIIPLSYDDGFEQKYFSPLAKDFIKVERNGTVSGTALSLALNYTNAEIYFCGLDQSCTKGFQHTQPNNLELLNELKDFRIKTKETRLTAAQFASKESLKIYSDWFIYFSKNTNRKIYRLSNNYKYSNTLGNIKDVDWTFFKKQNYKEDETTIILKDENFLVDTEKIKNCIKKINLQVLKKELFPLECNVLEHTLNNDEKSAIEQKIQKQTFQLEQYLSCYTLNSSI